MIRAGGLVLYLLVLLADRLSRLCRRLLGRRAELFLARVMAAALRRAVLYPLAKHATRRSHRLFERRQLAAPSSARPSEAEIAMSRDAYRSFDTLSIDGATGILQATGSTPELYTTPMNNNDIWGGDSDTTPRSRSREPLPGRTGWAITGARRSIRTWQG